MFDEIDAKFGPKFGPHLVIVRLGDATDSTNDARGLMLLARSAIDAVPLTLSH